MATNKLNRTILDSLRPDPSKSYKKSDGGGLFLEILSSGTMVWRYQYLLHGKREKVTIGTFKRAGDAKGQDRAIVSLKAARDEHARLSGLVSAGKSAAKEKQKTKQSRREEIERAYTFLDLVTRWKRDSLATKSQGWQSTVESWLTLDIVPALGKKDPREIDVTHLQQLLKRIATGRNAASQPAPASAQKVRAILRQIFQYAKSKNEIAVNPMVDVPPVVVPEVQSHRALRAHEIGPFLRALDASGGREQSRVAVRLLILTLVRKDELRSAVWSEIDFDNAVWTIPKNRMKMRREHTVYLSEQAQKLVLRLKELAGESSFVLPHFALRGRPMGRTTINSAVDRVKVSGARFVPHGFRATASSALNEMGFRADVIERQLAHAKNDVRSIYNQAEYAHERADMMQQWANYLDSLERGGNLVPMRFKHST